jgi:hypothetical protein
VFLYLLILIIDPYDSVFFSPRWTRYPVRGDHRHWNAMLVRQPGFDSAVIGTSSAMLLKPSQLNEAFSGSFVNLSMPAATPFEQLRLLELFQHYHPRIGTVVFGLDSLWCHPDGGRQFTNDTLRRAFPAWLYDTVTWNDLPPFNKTTLKAAYDQARALLGIFVRYQRWVDGYEDLTKTLHKTNDPEAVRKRIYESAKEGILWRNPGHSLLPTYPDLDRLGAALGRLPATTLKILFFSPYHHFHLPQPGSEQEALWNGCKEKAAGLADRVDNLVVVDFMMRSPITNDDSHYIDGYHYTTAIASRVMHLLREAADTEDVTSEEFRILARSVGQLAEHAGSVADPAPSVR